MAVGGSGAEPFWLDFVRTRRGVTLVVCDAHEGLKAAVTKMPRTTWRRRGSPGPPGQQRRGGRRPPPSGRGFGGTGRGRLGPRRGGNA